MQDTLQISLQLFDVVICVGWLILLAVNLREVGSYKKFTLDPAKTTVETYVSVIIPVRNEEERIASTLQSVLAQSMKSLEALAETEK